MLLSSTSQNGRLCRPFLRWIWGTSKRIELAVAADFGWFRSAVRKFTRWRSGRDLLGWPIDRCRPALQLLPEEFGVGAADVVGVHAGGIDGQALAQPPHRYSGDG